MRTGSGRCLIVAMRLASLYLPGLARAVRRVQGPRSRTFRKFACYMWEGYTTAHSTRVRHMRHARLEVRAIPSRSSVRVRSNCGAMR